MVRNETAWTWWTLPPAISGCFAQKYRGLPLGLVLVPAARQGRSNAGMPMPGAPRIRPADIAECDRLAQAARACNRRCARQ